MSDGDGAARILFLCGADMDPSAVRAAYPGARFVARARLDESDGDGQPAATAVWGILLRVPASTPVPGTDPDERQVVTDDGRPFPAAVVAGGRPAGDPAAVLAAARYWELPPAYVATLQAADRDAEDG